MHSTRWSIGSLDIRQPATIFDSGGSFQVQVSDGRLSVTNGTGAANNKVCFIEIVQVPVAVN